MEPSVIFNRATLTETPAAIDSAKVLIVVNSNVATSALSTQGADAYGALRGIPAANRLLYDMGSAKTMTSAAIAALRSAIQAEIVANNYEAVLFSMATPLYMTGDTDGNGASVPDLATRFSYDSNSGPGTTQTASWSVPASIEKIREHRTTRFTTHPKNAYARANLQPPNGRIGFPLFSDSVLTNESVSLMQARVADAIAAEQSGVWNSAQWIVSLHERLSQVSYYSEEALLVLRAAGLDPVFWYNTLSAGITGGSGSVVEGPQDAPSGVAWGTHANVIAGNVPAVEYLGYVGSALANTAGQVASFRPLPGAISFEWTSYSYVTGHELVLKGACSYMSSMTEPFSNHVMRQDRFVMGLMLGLSLCELSNTSEWSQIVAIGDPLYAPYRNIRRSTWVM